MALHYDDSTPIGSLFESLGCGAEGQNAMYKRFITSTFLL